MLDPCFRKRFIHTYITLFDILNFFFSDFRLSALTLCFFCLASSTSFRVRTQRLRLHRWYRFSTGPYPPMVDSTQYSHPSSSTARDRSICQTSSHTQPGGRSTESLGAISSPFYKKYGHEQDNVRACVQLPVVTTVTPPTTSVQGRVAGPQLVPGSRECIS